jgi:hypothetical protein
MNTIPSEDREARSQNVDFDLPDAGGLAAIERYQKNYTGITLEEAETKVRDAEDAVSSIEREVSALERRLVVKRTDMAHAIRAVEIAERVRHNAAIHDEHIAEWRATINRASDAGETL